MKSRFDGYNWIIRLDKGESLMKSLLKLVEQNDVPSCWLNGIGGAQSAKLKFYDLDAKEYKTHNVKELLEITGLQGDLTWIDGKPNFHIHGTFAKADLSVIGGHVEDVMIGGTCEILLRKWYGDNLTKSKDATTGLCTLDL